MRGTKSTVRACVRRTLQMGCAAMPDNLSKFLLTWIFESSNIKNYHIQNIVRTTEHNSPKSGLWTTL
jgi:hypothetical protein